MFLDFKSGLFESSTWALEASVFFSRNANFIQRRCMPGKKQRLKKTMTLGGSFFSFEKTQTHLMVRINLSNVVRANMKNAVDSCVNTFDGPYQLIKCCSGQYEKRCGVLQ